MPLEKECEDAVQWHKDMVKADQQLADRLNFLHQQRQKNRKEGRKQPDFKIGATVWVLRSPGGGSKIHLKRIGPCKILQRLGEHTWRVQVSPSRHRDVHASHLLPHQPPLQGPSWTLFHHLDHKEDEEVAGGMWNVERIVRHRKLPSGELQFLVRWEGFGPSNDTWETASQFLPQYSEPWAHYC